MTNEVMEIASRRISELAWQSAESFATSGPILLRGSAFVSENHLTRASRASPGSRGRFFNRSFPLSLSCTLRKKVVLMWLPPLYLRSNRALAVAHQCVLLLPNGIFSQEVWQRGGLVLRCQDVVWRRVRSWFTRCRSHSSATIPLCPGYANDDGGENSPLRWFGQVLDRPKRSGTLNDGSQCAHISSKTAPGTPGGKLWYLNEAADGPRIQQDQLCGFHWWGGWWPARVVAIADPALLWRLQQSESWQA